MAAESRNAGGLTRLGARAGRRLGALSGSWGERLRLAAWHLGRQARRVLLRAGFPLRKEFLVLSCADGSEASGLFSEFAAVLGMLEHYERWRPVYAGVRVDFGRRGLYFDRDVGDNWWSYYFEPIDVGSPERAVAKAVSPDQHDELALRIDAMDRALGARLIERYIRVRAPIREEADRFAASNFEGAYVVGVHYRGTDKASDLPPVPYGSVWSAVERAIGEHGSRPWKVFIATDEAAFLDFARRQAGEQVLARDAIRSSDGLPVHKRRAHRHRMGAEALIDCLLLARSEVLVRTSSNLGLCSTLLNPTLREVVLSKEPTRFSP